MKFALALLAPLLLSACATGTGQTSWSRITVDNGYSVDWRGTVGYIDIQNPMNTRIHIWGVASLDNYSHSNNQFYSANQEGGFDQNLDPSATTTVACAGLSYNEASTYHLNIHIEPAN